jgi:hypothetical protein
MTKPAVGLIVLMAAVPSVASAADLARYREFQFGTELATVARQAGTDPSLVKTVHRRPALIQELEWHPRLAGGSSKTEAVENVVLTFYAGNLFRITVQYDRYETEGLTVDDLVETISATYGPAARPNGKVATDQSPYREPEELLASWEDPQYRFDLSRKSYGPTFKLVGVLKSLAAQAQTANLEARRLDEQEAPQRDAARIATEEESAKAKLEKARLVNKPNFRP